MTFARVFLNWRLCCDFCVCVFELAFVFLNWRLCFALMGHRSFQFLSHKFLDKMKLDKSQKLSISVSILKLEFCKYLNKLKLNFGFVQVFADVC